MDGVSPAWWPDHTPRPPYHPRDPRVYLTTWIPYVYKALWLTLAYLYCFRSNDLSLVILTLLWPPFAVSMKYESPTAQPVITSTVLTAAGIGACLGHAIFFPSLTPNKWDFIALLWLIPAMIYSWVIIFTHWGENCGIWDYEEYAIRRKYGVKKPAFEPWWDRLHDWLLSKGRSLL